MNKAQRINIWYNDETGDDLWMETDDGEYALVPWDMWEHWQGCDFEVKFNGKWMSQYARDLNMASELLIEALSATPGSDWYDNVEAARDNLEQVLEKP